MRRPSSCDPGARRNRTQRGLTSMGRGASIGCGAPPDPEELTCAVSAPTTALPAAENNPFHQSLPLEWYQEDPPAASEFVRPVRWREPALPLTGSCTSDAPAMHQRCTPDAPPVPACASLVHRWCIWGASLVPGVPMAQARLRTRQMPGTCVGPTGRPGPSAAHG